MVQVAALQMCSGPDIEKNFEAIEKGLGQAKSQGALGLVCPEECLTLGMTDQQKLALSHSSDEILARLSKIARNTKCWLIAGSVPLAFSNTHYYSTCVVFDSDGSIVSKYQKIHLFDVVVENSIAYKESDYVQEGTQIQVVDSPFGKIGLSICYDVRFAYHYQALSDKGAQVFLVPSAFTTQTGKAHWEVLLRARAIENLCYVIAAGQNGLRPNGEGTYGHSCIIHPWGEVIAERQAGEGLVSADLDFQAQDLLRSNFPVLRHRRQKDTP